MMTCGTSRLIFSKLIVSFGTVVGNGIGVFVGSSLGRGVSAEANTVAEGSTGSVMSARSVEVVQLAQNEISTKISVDGCIHGIFTMNFPFYAVGIILMILC